MLLDVICQRGDRPPRPQDPAVQKHGLDDSVWFLMTRAWYKTPVQRPTASEVSTHLQGVIRGTLTAPHGRTRSSSQSSNPKSQSTQEILGQKATSSLPQSAPTLGPGHSRVHASKSDPDIQSSLKEPRAPGLSTDDQSSKGEELSRISNSPVEHIPSTAIIQSHSSQDSGTFTARNDPKSFLSFVDNATTKAPPPGLSAILRVTPPSLEPQSRPAKLSPSAVSRPQPSESNPAPLLKTNSGHEATVNPRGTLTSAEKLRDLRLHMQDANLDY